METATWIFAISAIASHCLALWAILGWRRTLDDWGDTVDEAMKLAKHNGELLTALQVKEVIDNHKTEAPE